MKSTNRSLESKLRSSTTRVTKQMKEVKSRLSRLKCDMDFDVYTRFDTLTLKIDASRAETAERFDLIDEFITLTENRSNRYEARLFRLEQGMDKLDQRMDKLEQRMDTIPDQIVNLVAPMFEAMFTRLDARLSAIEKMVGL